jgi:hypothetical protein
LKCCWCAFMEGPENVLCFDIAPSLAKWVT